MNSCKKKPVVEINKNFIGTWLHYSNLNDYKYIKIITDGRGDIETIENFKEVNHTKTRKWFLKDVHLYFGRSASGNEKFTVDIFPALSNNYSINNFDTITASNYYMVLDGNYFIKH